jgi:hypothetical protein
MMRLTVLTAALMAGVLSGPGASHAQSDETAGQSPGEVIPVTIIEPDILVRQMAALLSSTEAFTLHIEKTFDEVQSDGAKVQFSGAADIAIRRPDGFYIDYGDQFTSKEFWYDGNTFTLYDRHNNVYASVAAPPHIDGALDQLASDYDVRLPLAGLFYADAFGRYAANVRTRRYLGLHDVDGVPSHHLLLRGDHVDWQLWIEAGERPLPRKVVVTYKNLEGAPQHNIILTDWNLGAEVEDGWFAANVPDGAVKIEFMKVREPDQ